MSDESGRSDALFAGIDIGGTSIKWTIVDLKGRTLFEGSAPTDPDSVAGQSAQLVGDLVSAHPAIVGLGACCPGIVDEDRGIVVYASNLNLREAELRLELEEAAGRPIRLLHDGRSAGLAEGLLGAGRGASSFVMIPIGTGISAALCFGGDLWAGASFSAGEIGHSPVFPEGEACACGQRGCLEVYASAKGLVKRYRAAGGEAAGARGVEARLGEDPRADEVWAAAVDALAISLTQMTFAFDPERFVIGGGLSRAGEVLLDPLRRELASRLRWRKAPEVVRAGLGSTAGRWGALIAAARAVGSECYREWSVLEQVVP